MAQSGSDDSKKVPEIIFGFGTVDLGGKGPGSYVGGTAKLGKNLKEDLLASAEAFRKAADRALNSCKIEPGIEILTVPGAVCAAFAIELYLKYLHLVETGALPRKLHELDELFSGLSSNVQTALSVFKPDIADVVKRNKDQFKAARYHHEEEQFSFREAELLQLAECLSKFIRDRYKGSPNIG